MSAFDNMNRGLAMPTDSKHLAAQPWRTPSAGITESLGRPSVHDVERCCETCDRWLPDGQDDPIGVDHCMLWGGPCDPRHVCGHWKLNADLSGNYEVEPLCEVWR